MVRSMRAIFRRMDTVEIAAGDRRFLRHGVVQPLRNGRPDFGGDITDVYGTRTAPLSVYYGDAAELPELCEMGVEITAGDARYRVLSAERRTGFGGGLYVRAVLEREADA